MKSSTQRRRFYDPPIRELPPPFRSTTGMGQSEQVERIGVSNVSTPIQPIQGYNRNNRNNRTRADKNRNPDKGHNEAWKQDEDGRMMSGRRIGMEDGPGGVGWIGENTDIERMIISGWARMEFLFALPYLPVYRMRPPSYLRIACTDGKKTASCFVSSCFPIS